jgi:two-component system OmpR family response regulator
MTNPANQAPALEAAVEFAEWRLDLVRRRLRNALGREVELSDQEFFLLCAFLAQPREPLSRERLLATLNPERGAVSARAVDVQVSRLRRKLGGDDLAAPELIRTLRGRGYLFMAAVRRVGAT